MEHEFDLVNLFAVLLVAWVTGALAMRVGYPAVVGELAAGILFGPAVLEMLQTGPGLEALAQVGVFLMMLYIGIEVDHRELLGASWGGLLAAVGGFILPVVLGSLAMWLVGRPVKESIFLGIAMGVTALAVNSRILIDLQLLGTRLANVLIAGALISDTAAIVVFSAFLGIVNAGSLQFGTVAVLLGNSVLFFGVSAALGVWVFPFVGRRLVQAGFTQRTANFTLILLVAMVFAEMAELAGLHAILGAFIAGLFLREEVLMRKLSQDISALVHDLSIGFLAPVFFVTVAFNFSFEVFTTAPGMLAVIVIVATLAKTLGTVLLYLPASNGWREALVISAGMNGRGAVDVIFAGIGCSQGVISKEVFSALIFLAFLNASIVPFLLKRGAEWLRRRGELVRADEQRSGTIIVGAGPLARLLAGELSRTGSVRLIDTNAENCAAAAAEGLTVVNANALREETLSMANAGRARAFIALTPSAEVNRFSAQLARSVFGVPEIHVPQVSAAHPEGGVPLFGGRISVGDWNRWLTRMEAERDTVAVARSVTPEEFFAEVNVHGPMLPLLVVRDGRPHLFHTVSQLRGGDEVVALRFRQAHDPLQDRLDTILRNCSVLDIAGQVSLEEFFRRVAETMAPRVHVPEDEIVHLLLERERDSSTVILPSVAIPHLIVDGEHVFDLLMARCREGIHFSEHGPRVRLVFVIVGSKDERNFHLRALSAIGQLFQHPDFEERWMQAEGPDELRSLVLSVERRRFSDRRPAGGAAPSPETSDVTTDPRDVGVHPA